MDTAVASSVPVVGLTMDEDVAQFWSFLEKVNKLREHREASPRKSLVFATSPRRGTFGSAASHPPSASPLRSPFKSTANQLHGSTGSRAPAGKAPLSPMRTRRAARSLWATTQNVTDNEIGSSNEINSSPIGASSNRHSSSSSNNNSNNSNSSASYFAFGNVPSISSDCSSPIKTDDHSDMWRPPHICSSSPPGCVPDVSNTFRNKRIFDSGSSPASQRRLFKNSSATSDMEPSSDFNVDGEDDMDDDDDNGEDDDDDMEPSSGSGEDENAENNAMVLRVPAAVGPSSRNSNPNKPTAWIHCEIAGCSAKFSSRRLHREHVQSHDQWNNGRFYCDFPGCDKSFCRGYSLKYHRYTHTEDAPFVCTFKGCEKRFSHLSRLKRHILSHTPEDKSFACSSCGKRFSQKCHLKIHMQSHERKEARKRTQVTDDGHG